MPYTPLGFFSSRVFCCVFFSGEASHWPVRIARLPWAPYSSSYSFLGDSCIEFLHTLENCLVISCLRWALAVSLLLGFCAPLLQAETFVIKELEFNLDGVLPSVDPDIAFSTSGISEQSAYSVEGGFLKQRTTGVTGNMSYNAPNLQLSGNTLSSSLGTTIEARLNILDLETEVWGDNYPGYGAFFGAYDGANRYGAFFVDNGIDLRTPTGNVTVPFDHSSGFNTYRLTSPADKPEYSLYINGQHEATVQAQAGGLNGFNWGDGLTAGANGADVDWDYLRVYQGDEPAFRLPAPEQIQLDRPSIPDYDSSLMAFDSSGIARPLDHPGVFSQERPSIILTHGWDSSLDIFARQDGNGIDNLAAALKRPTSHPAFQDGVNVLTWDWRGAAQNSIVRGSDILNLLDWGQAGQNAIRQGTELGEALEILLGESYDHPMHFIGHSFGTRVNKNAVDHLAQSSFSSDTIHVTNLDGAEFTTVPRVSNPRKIPIPTRAVRHIDSYVTAFAGLHPEASNIFLFEDVFDVPSVLRLDDFHSLPIDWYRDSVLTPVPGVGHAVSFERGTIDSADPPGTYLRQLDNGLLAPLSESDAFALLAAREAKTKTSLALGSLVLSAIAVKGIAATGTVGIVGATFVGGPLVAPFPAEFISSITLEAFSPAYVELKLDVPSNAEFLSLEFLPVNLSSGDIVAVAIDDSLVLHASGDEFEQSILNGVELIDLSQWSGHQVDLFIGLDSPGGTGQKVEVHNLRFLISVPEPASAMIALFASVCFAVQRWPATRERKSTQSSEADI